MKNTPVVIPLVDGVPTEPGDYLFCHNRKLSGEMRQWWHIDRDALETEKAYYETYRSRGAKWYGPFVLEAKP